ncbi:MAG TPA: hypothetical protein VH092_25310 [Urbifossiella sp.]|nr:hypothetical protein [Urbifossiella sp.]
MRRTRVRVRVTVWRRMQEWTRAGVWPAVYRRLLGHLGRAAAADPSTVVADSASCRAVKGALPPGKCDRIWGGRPPGGGARRR